MKRLDLAHIARTDLDAIRRYSVRTWGEPQTAHDRMDFRRHLGVAAGPDGDD